MVIIILSRVEHSLSLSMILMIAESVSWLSPKPRLLSLIVRNTLKLSVFSGMLSGRIWKQTGSRSSSGPKTKGNGGWTSKSTPEQNKKMVKNTICGWAWTYSTIHSHVNSPSFAKKLEPCWTRTDSVCSEIMPPLLTYILSLKTSSSSGKEYSTSSKPTEISVNKENYH